MPSSTEIAKKKTKAQAAAKYVTDLRAYRKRLGFELVHWYVHESALKAILQAAEKENRKVQQYVTLNIWKLVPEELHPKNIPAESLILPKAKRVRLNLKIRLKPKGTDTKTP